LFVNSYDSDPIFDVLSISIGEKRPEIPSSFRELGVVQERMEAKQRLFGTGRQDMTVRLQKPNITEIAKVRQNLERCERKNQQM
jgi:hypothetical protein